MPKFPDAVTAERLFDAHLTHEAPLDVGAGPYGHRSIHIVTGGTFEGPRMRGTYLPGADWLLSSSGYGELDVRVTMKTDDGALIYLAYRGVLKVEPDVARRVFAGDDVDPAEYYFRTTPRFETGHETYGWLNSTVTVAYGYFGPSKVGYRVFAIK